MKKSSKKTAKSYKLISRLVIISLAIVVVFFASGVVIWTFFPMESLGVFQVSPLEPGSTPVEEIFPVEPEATEVPVDIPVETTNDVGNPEIMPIAPDNRVLLAPSPSPTAKPNIIKQSMLGWKIIVDAVKNSL